MSLLADDPYEGLASFSLACMQSERKFSPFRSKLASANEWEQGTEARRLAGKAS